MSALKEKKINQLINSWPKGSVYTQKFLSGIGYSKDLVKIYKKNKWIESIGIGAYKRLDDTVDWQGGLYPVQSQLKFSVHAGGKTALQLKGLAHYLMPEMKKCYLFGTTGTNLPKWFQNYKWNVEIVYKTTKLFPENLPHSFTKLDYREFDIRISVPERAVLEMLYYVPEKQGFDEAFKIVENLMTLRPALVQQLIENCNSVKVKRLFLYMSEKNNHPWFEQLNLSKINLGKGKRVIIKNGKLDKKYLITVPQTELD